MNACTAARSIRSRIVVEDEPVVEVVLHAAILPAAARRCSGTVEGVGRIGIMLCVALPLAAADLLVKANEPTEPWAYHERSLGWLALSLALLAGMVVIARIPSVLVAPAAGVLAGGVLGNSLSAAWNGMEVPNPLDRRRRSTASIAFNLADVWALAGIFAARLRDRRLADPQPRPDSRRRPRCASTRGRAFRRLFEDDGSR